MNTPLPNAPEIGKKILSLMAQKGYANAEGAPNITKMLEAMPEGSRVSYPTLLKAVRGESVTDETVRLLASFFRVSYESIAGNGAKAPPQPASIPPAPTKAPLPGPAASTGLPKPRRTWKRTPTIQVDPQSLAGIALRYEQARKELAECENRIGILRQEVRKTWEELKKKEEEVSPVDSTQ